MSTISLSDISAMRIDELKKEGFTLKSNDTNTLYGTSSINVLIGENSAGKSRLLRLIFTKHISQIDISSNLQNKLMKVALENIDRLDNSYSHSIYPTSIKNALEKLPHAPLDSELNTWICETLNGALRPKRNRRGSYDALSEALSQALNSNFQQELSEITELCASVSELQQTREYIPILRGLRPLDPHKDLFEERTSKDYFSSNKTFTIFTGHSLYSDLVHSKLGSEEEIKSIKRFETYLSKHFFGGKPVNLHPKKDRAEATKQNDVVYVKIGQEPMRPIYELGDGIQAIITLTVRPFLTQEPTTFFIEEPEQHLHAGMQRALIQAFRACPTHRYFFTTQSNHFIDLSLESDDISLFSVKKTLDEEHNTRSEVINQKDRSAILKDLGVLASSVLLANCSIWVEGITDKLYLRIYLQRFIDELKIKLESSDYTPDKRAAYSKRHKKLTSFNENLHYVFVEYQGSNITHWDFSSSDDDLAETPARMLSKDIFLLADQDIDKKGTRVEDLNSTLGKNFCLLDWKEIENYIPQDVIIRTSNERWGTFKGKADSNFDPSSISNKAFENTTGIGEILEQAVERLGDVKDDRKFFEDTSGTIKDKVKFCETACKIMGSDGTQWQLTPELEKICDRIWTFIEANNKI